jgi:hypothetical protein
VILLGLEIQMRSKVVVSAKRDSGLLTITR